MSKINYKAAGVDIDAGNEAVDRIKNKVKSTFTPNVLTGLGGFGSLFNLKSVLKNYKNPVLVQSIDGVGTKTIIARKLKKFDTIGIDLLSACANDIIVMGAQPLTFLDYIASEKLQPLIIDEIVSGMIKGCVETNVSLVGGETAEMPDTYLKGEHDLVGIITGVVEKEKIITGENIKAGDVVIGLPSSGLHTNGYSLARKLFFDIGGYSVHDNIPELNKPVGLTLLEPHINYTNHISSLINSKVTIKGIAHITGGGFLENIPRILPNGLDININKNSFPSLPVFSCMQSLGNLDQTEMYRTFNMGIGMIIVINKETVKDAKKILTEHITTYEIGQVVNGNKQVNIL
tara:strand:+ start:2037 stop:3074 length:1038 start_codon:yes stop_codon:yes gene_type:complete